MTLKIQKTLSKSLAKLFQASVALIGSQNRESIGNSLFIHCTLVKKQGTGLGGDISISKVVFYTHFDVHCAKNFADYSITYAHSNFLHFE